LFGLLRGPGRPPRPLGAPGEPRPLAAVRETIMAQLVPERGVVPQLAARISGVAADAIARFDPMVVRPVLEQPLIQALARLGPEPILPNIGAIAADRVALATTDPAIVRALLVGANDELGRELLWRGFPGELGHTWMHTFWGRVSRGSDGTIQPVP